MLEDVEEDWNCGFRSLELKLYSIDELYGDIKNNVYKYLKNHKEDYKDYNFENILNA